MRGQGGGGGGRRSAERGSGNRGGPRFPPAPDETAYTADIEAIEARIAALRQDLSVIEETQQANSRELRRLSAKNRERNDALQVYFKVLDERRARKRDLLVLLRAKTQQIHDAKAAVASKAAAGGAKSARLGSHNRGGGGDGGGGNGNGTSNGNGNGNGNGGADQRRQTKARIRALEYKQQTESMSLAHEKLLLKELSQLRAAAREHASVDKLFADKKTLHAKLDAAEVAIKQATAALDAAREELNRGASFEVVGEDGDASSSSLSPEERVQELRGQKPLLERAYGDLKRSIDEAFRQKKERYAAHWEAKREWKRLMDEWHDDQREQRRREEAQWRQEEDQRRRLQQLELEQQKPWQEEIALCDLLINFCKRWVPHMTATAAPPAAAAAPSAPAAKANGVGVGTAGTVAAEGLGLGSILPRKEKGNRYGKKKHKAPTSGGGGGGGGGGETVKRGKVVQVVHTPDSISGFTKLGVVRPVTTADVAAALAALRDRRAYYDTLPRHPAPEEERSLNKKKDSPLADHGDDGNDGDDDDDDDDGDRGTRAAAKAAPPLAEHDDAEREAHSEGARADGGASQPVPVVASVADTAAAVAAATEEKEAGVTVAGVDVKTAVTAATAADSAVVGKAGLTATPSGPGPGDGGATKATTTSRQQARVEEEEEKEEKQVDEEVVVTPPELPAPKSPRPMRAR
jgi:hypothetical protein